MIATSLRYFTTGIGVSEVDSSAVSGGAAPAYRVADTADALAILLRSEDQGSEALTLIQGYQQFLRDSQSQDGGVVEHRSNSGAWVGLAECGEAWGHSLWAWGVAVRHSRDADLAAESYDHFCQSAQLRSRDLRALAFAVLGAAQILEVFPGNPTAQKVLGWAAEVIPQSTDPRWMWPEPQLRHANGSVAEMMLLVGTYANRPDAFHTGRRVLEWLWDLQCVAGRLSVVPSSGWQPGDPLPAIDQRPIEVASLISACATAFDLTGDPIWRERVLVGRRWFDGHNDQGVPMLDVHSGRVFGSLSADPACRTFSAQATIAFLGVENRTANLGQLVN